MIGRAKAEFINQQGIECQKSGQLQEAVKLFEQAAALAPRWSTPLYNLGLLFKSQRNWEKSLHYNRRALRIDSKNDAAAWNLGIAATALGRWDVARSAWRAFGINVPPGDGPVDLPCGFGPIRLNPDGDAEIVWAQRLDPARAELASIPFPESGHRWKDVVLNDGAPVGYRQYQGQEIPVFNELQLLEPSPFGTYVARVALPPDRDFASKVSAIAARLDGSAEDWSTSVRLLCKACSEGRPHATHDTESAPRQGTHLIGIAARSHDHAESIAAGWQAEIGDVRIESLEGALDAG